MPLAILGRMARPPRFPSFSYIGLHSYFLTCCTFGRRPVFVTPEPVEVAVQQFRKTAAEEGFVILAYCFMPDHVHLLVSADREAADLRQFVKIGKQRAGHLFARKHGGALWQEGYYDHVVRSDEPMRRLVRYILENPVRAGLARSVAEYPYSGSDVYSISEILAGLT